jgi:hypothetical protein
LFQRLSCPVVIVVLISAFSLTCARAEIAQQVTITPELADGSLINPGAGWQLITYVPPKDEVEKLPEISTFYTRYGWNSFETAPGKYGDTPVTKLIDSWLEYCKKHNRYLGFRVVTWDPGSDKSLVPDYVFESGAKRFPEPGSTTRFVPAFWDKTFLDRHEKLVEWMGQRWGKHPNLAYIDVPGGGYGEWNFMATGNAKMDLNYWKANGIAPETWDPMVARMIDMYSKNFPNHLLLSSYGIVDFSKASNGEYCVGRNLGWRDDGMGMSYATAGKHNPMFEKYWKKVPCLFENGYIDWTSFGDRSKVEPCIDWAVNQCHASIITIGKGDENCLKAYTQYKDIVTNLGKKLGYHFAIQQAQYYNRPVKGQNFNVALQIDNTGNAPVYFDCKVEFSFVDDAGQVLGQEYAEVNPPVRQWLPGAAIPVTATFKVPGNLPTTSARLCIGIVNAAIPEQRLQLPLKNSAGDRRYVLGPVIIQGAGFAAASAQPIPTSAASSSAAQPAAALDMQALEPWNTRLVARVIQGVKDGQSATVYLKVLGTKEERVKVTAADEKALTCEVDGMVLPPLAWSKLDARDRLSLASGFMKDTSAADHLLVAVFDLATNHGEQAADHFAKAQLCDPKPDASLLSSAKALFGAK